MGLFSRSNSNAATITPAPASTNGNGASKAGLFAAPGQEATLKTDSVLHNSSKPVMTPLSAPTRPAPIVAQQLTERQIYLQQFKVRLHQQLVDRLDMQNIKAMPAE